MITAIQRLGRSGIDLTQGLGRSGVFIAKAIVRPPQLRQWFGLLCGEIYQLGVLSLVIILVSGLFIGMVVSLQGYHTLVKFAAQPELGSLLALSIVRELGPVITALLFAGRAGSALTAEIGLMKASDQLAAMEMMAVDPISKVIAPRFWAGIISLPILTLLFNVVAIYGGYFIGVHWLGVDGGAFWNNMHMAVNFRLDIVNGIIKSLVFAIAITWIAVYQGYYSVPNPSGVSQATTKTVVVSSVFILGLDFILTALMMGGW